MNATPSRITFAKSLLGLVTVLATIFGGLIASPASAVASKAEKVLPPSKMWDYDYDFPNEIWGYVSDSFGTPYENVDVELVDPYSEEVLTVEVTDSEGYFNFYDLNGEYLLHFVPNDGGESEWFENVSSAADAEWLTSYDDQGIYLETWLGSSSGGGGNSGSAFVEGYAYDSAGDPAAGVTATLLNYNGDTIAESVADEFGWYSFDGLGTDDYTVCYEGGGYAYECYQDASERWDAEFVYVVDGDSIMLEDVTLTLAGSISGHVWPSNTDSPGLEGVYVYAYSFTGWGWDQVDSAVTDSLGYYEFPSLTAGYYRIAVDPGGTSWAPEWYLGGTRSSEASPVSVYEGEVTSGIDFSLEEGGSISTTAWCGEVGTLCEEFGQVRLFSLDDTLPSGERSSASAEATFEGLQDGRYYVIFSSNGQDYYWGTDGTQAGAEVIEIIGANDVTDVGHVYPAPVELPLISGTVDLTDGVPITVYLLGEPDEWDNYPVITSATTDEFGYYELTANPGRYTLQFGEDFQCDDEGNCVDGTADYWGNAYRVSRATWFDLAEGDVFDAMDFTPLVRNVTISGTVRTTTSTVIGDVEISLSGPNGSTEIVTAANGTYRVTGLTPGLYSISMRKSGYVTTWHHSVRSRPTVNAISASGTYTLNGTLAVAAASISGRVTLSSQPVLGSSVVAKRKADDCAVAWSEVDGAGNYRLTGLPAGTYTVTAGSSLGSRCGQSGDGSGSTIASVINQSRDITVTATQALANQNFALLAGGQIRGSIVDEFGSTVIDQQAVTVYGMNNEFITNEMVESDGTFTVKGLPTGTYYIKTWEGQSTASSWWTNGTTRRVPVNVTAGATVSNINIVAVSPATIQGFTRMQNGRPFTASEIQAFDMYDQPVGNFDYQDSSGLYEITNLPAGPVRVRVTVSGVSYWAGGGTALSTANSFTMSSGGFTSIPDVVVPNLSSVSGQTTIAGRDSQGGVSLIDSTGREVKSVSAVNGRYKIDDIIPGVYTVRFTSTNDETVWYGNKDSLASAGYFTVAAGVASENINLNGVESTAAFTPGVLTTTGVVKVGQTVSVSAGTWTPTPSAIQYRWFAEWGGPTISTSASYVIKPEDQGKFLSVEILVTKHGVVPDRMFIDIGQVVGLPLTAMPTPTISGTAKVGSVLTAVPGTWSPAPVTVSYQWFKNGVQIFGATGNTYVPTADDAGARITVRTLGVKPGYTGMAKFSAQTAAVALQTLTTAPVPTVTGTKTVGSVLTANPGTWAPAPVGLTYQWKRGGSAIPGATAATYTLTSADAGATLTVSVTGSKVGFLPVEKTSVAVTGITKPLDQLTAGTPTISGVKRVGETLTAAPGTWTAGTALAYQWFRNGAPIRNARGNTYDLTAADLNSTIRVQVKGTKSGYAASTVVSNATSAISIGLLPIDSVIVDLVGTGTKGEQLSVDSSGWGSVPVKLTYMWLRDGNPIFGASKRTYTPTTRDVDSVISVVVFGSAPGYESDWMESDGLSITAQ